MAVCVCNVYATKCVSAINGDDGRNAVEVDSWEDSPTPSASPRGPRGLQNEMAEGESETGDGIVPSRCDSPTPSSLYRGSRITFEDASDATLLSGVLRTLQGAARVCLLCLAVQLSAQANGPSASLQRVSEVVMLDAVSVVFILTGFGAVYLSLISPVEVFAELAWDFLTGLIVDNAIGSVLTCAVCSLCELLSDRFVGDRIGATLLEAVLHTHLWFLTSTQNLNPVMWVHYALVGVGVLALSRAPPPLEGSTVELCHTRTRLLIAAASVLGVAHVAVCVATLHPHWFYIALTTPPLRVCEVLGGGLLAYYAVIDPDSVQNKARQWRFVLQAPLLLFVVLCWAHEVGVSAQSAQSIAPDACLSLDGGATCMTQGMLFIPRSWVLACSLLARALWEAGACAREDDAEVEELDSLQLDSRRRERATEDVIDAVRRTSLLVPSAALAWPLLTAVEVLLHITGLYRVLAGNCLTVVLGPFIITAVLSWYARAVRADAAAHFTSNGAHVLGALHFARQRICCAA